MPKDADHAIITRPWEFELIEFCYQRPNDGGEPYVDLVFQKAKEKRRLRFFSPRDIHISGGPSPSSIGLTILDIRNRQMDGLGIRVESYEASNGAPQFWARTVEEVYLGSE